MKKRVFIIIGCLVLIIHLLSAIFVDSKVNNIELSYPTKHRNLNGYSIIYISDIHHRNIEKVKDDLSYYKNQKADLLVLGGDYTSNVEEDEKLFSVIKESNIASKTIVTLGNHDVKASLDKAKEFGFITLDNSGIEITNNLYVGGVQDLWTGFPNIDKAFEGSKQNDFRLLLAHNPDTILDYNNNIDLVLSGHTHGGEVTLFGIIKPSLFLITKKPLDFGGGLVKLENKSVYVSKGLGKQKNRVRVFAQPEIVKIKLQYKK